MIKISYLLSIFLLFPIFFVFTSVPVFAEESTEKCITTLWFTKCFNIPSRSPKPTLPPIPNPFIKPVLVGANLRLYRQPHGRNCDIKVPTQFISIQAAINVATNGNTICVDSGTYNEDVLINKSIRLSGKGASKSIINGQDPNASGTVYITAKNVIVEGFSINGAGNTRGTGAVRLFEQVFDTIIRYNRIIAGNGQLAFLTDNAQNNNLVQNNILIGNNSPDIAKVNAFDSNKPTDKVNFLNNTFLGTVSPTEWQTEAFVLDAGAPNSLIKQNVFNATGTMVAVIASNNSSGINENNFNSGGAIKVAGEWGPPDLNAENNWWGDTNPSDNIQGAIDFTPFAIAPFIEN